MRWVTNPLKVNVLSQDYSHDKRAKPTPDQKYPYEARKKVLCIPSQGPML
jgi:hypothetical protein